MILYIRDKSVWINFVNSPEELTNFLDALSKHPTVVGDLTLFNSKMKNILLKAMEENPNLSVYSSTDLVDGPILSRVMKVVKSPLSYQKSGISLESFEESDKSYLAIDMFLSNLSGTSKLIAKGLDRKMLNILIAGDGNHN